MTKQNPLFVDSTRGFGESLSTRVELSGPCLEEGEILEAAFRDNNGRGQLIALRQEGDVWVGEAALGHQKMITYEFQLRKEGQTLAQSTPRQVVASHMILDQWHPQRVVAGTTPPATAEKKPAREEMTYFQVFPESDSFEELIDKWGL